MITSKSKYWKLEGRNKNSTEKFYIKAESWKRITQFHFSVVQTLTIVICDPFRSCDTEEGFYYLQLYNKIVSGRIVARR